MTLDLVLDVGKRRRQRVLCIGAHCDDIEIGCGAALLGLQARHALTVDWVVLSGSDARRKESQSAMNALVRRGNRGRLLFGDFPDGRFPSVYGGIKDFLESAKATLPVPDVIFCHERDDRHQDHRTVNEMAWNTFRDHLLLEYEIPKWDGGLGEPNLYVPVSARHAAAKIDALLKAHRSQSGKDWFTRDVFMALLRLRGVECRSPTGYAEAFHGRKLRLGTR